MKKGETVQYEWDIETFSVDEHEDIEDHHFAYRLADLKSLFPLPNNQRLVLVRNIGNDTEGILDRQWAYIEEGGLPERFCDAHLNRTAKVPRKYHKEFNDIFST